MIWLNSKLRKQRSIAVHYDNAIAICVLDPICWLISSSDYRTPHYLITFANWLRTYVGARQRSDCSVHTRRVFARGLKILSGPWFARRRWWTSVYTQIGPSHAIHHAIIDLHKSSVRRNTAPVSRYQQLLHLRCMLASNIVPEELHFTRRKCRGETPFHLAPTPYQTSFSRDLITEVLQILLKKIHI